MIAAVVATLRLHVTSAFVIVRGFVPNEAVAPAGSPTALAVNVHGLLLPFFVAVNPPYVAVPPGATLAVVGAMSVSVLPG